MATSPDIYIVTIKPNGDIIPLRQLNTISTPFGEIIDPLISGQNYSFSNKTITLSSSLLSIEQDKIGIAVKFPDPGWKLQNLNISNFELSTTTRSKPNSPDNIFYEPNFTEDFTNNDYNALLGNAFIPRYSEYFMDVDYSTSPIVGSSLTPINFDQLIANTATRAPIQDYYYNLRRHIIPRYLGSKSTAPSFNAFSIDTKDKGFGKDIVAGNPKPFVGYYGAKGGSTPEVIGKTIINLDYIIDEDINTQVPALSDFTYNNQIQLFERGTYLYLDPSKTATGQQFAGNRKYKIYRSGEYATPILYSQTGSLTGFLPSLTFLLPGTSPTPNYYKSTFKAILTSGTGNNYSLQNQLFYRTDYNEYNSYTDADIASGQPDTQPPQNEIWDYLTWNQLSFENISFTGSAINYQAPANYSNIKVVNFTSFPPGIQFKVKASIKIRWNNPNFLGDIRVSLRIKGLPANGWTFQSLSNPAPAPTVWLSGPESTKTITVESDIITADANNLNGVFVQGLAYCSNISIFSGDPDPFAYMSFIRNRINILDSSFEIIQVPEPTETIINYTSQTPYILDTYDYPDAGFGPYSYIYLTSSFQNVYGQIYPQVPESGYDSTIYPFELSSINSDFTSPSIIFHPEYEIRFGADESLVFPIIGIDTSNPSIVLIVSRPELQSIQNIPSPTLNSFLIRRWIPRAGYIYLDVSADLGSGIVKPEYITDGIKNKIPQIIKELTDKGLI